MSRVFFFCFVSSTDASPLATEAPLTPAPFTTSGVVATDKDVLDNIWWRGCWNPQAVVAPSNNNNDDGANFMVIILLKGNEWRRKKEPIPLRLHVASESCYQKRFRGWVLLLCPASQDDRHKTTRCSFIRVANPISPNSKLGGRQWVRVLPTPFRRDLVTRCDSNCRWQVRGRYGTVQNNVPY